MGLEELEEHVTDQTLKINELINSSNLFPTSWNLLPGLHSEILFGGMPLERQGGSEARKEAEVAAEGDGEPPPDAAPTQPVVKIPETPRRVEFRQFTCLGTLRVHGS